MKDDSGTIEQLTEDSRIEDSNPVEERSFEIYDLMACNIYWDLGGFPGAERQHKYLFAFRPGAFNPVCVKSIVAYDPNGHETEIKNQEYTVANLDGHIYDSRFGNYWYQKNVRHGFMEPGEHRIEVTYKNGDVRTISRIQDNEASDALLNSYLQNKDRIKYFPAGNLPEGTDLSKLEARWSSLKDLGGVDAYYIFRLSRGDRSTQFNIQDLVYWDNVFVERISDPSAGLNRNSVAIKATLQPNVGYVWFTEITDSNKMGGSNLCVFQPMQAFRTP